VVIAHKKQQHLLLIEQIRHISRVLLGQGVVGRFELRDCDLPRLEVAGTVWDQIRENGELDTRVALQVAGDGDGRLLKLKVTL